MSITVRELQEEEGAERHECRLRFSSGEIVEIEPTHSRWYQIEPSPIFIDLVARFVQRMIWRRDGVEPQELPRGPLGLTVAGVLNDEAREIALAYGREICAHIEIPQEEFVELADDYCPNLLAVKPTGRVS